MTLRHIRIFLTVCQYDHHITHAAEALHMTQPAVSLAIRELEEYYGVTLFDRIGRRLSITEAGQRFREYSQRIAALYDDMELSLRNWDAFGVLRVGASVTIGTRFLPGYVQAYQAQYPGVDVRATVERSERLEQKVLDNALDFALIEGTAHAPSLISRPYMEDHLVVLAPVHGPLCAATLTPAQFAAQPLLLREVGSGTRETFDAAMARAGLSVTPMWQSTSNSALLQAVQQGLGLAVLSGRIAAGALQQGLVRQVTVQGLQFPRQFRIIYHKDKRLSENARAFMRLCLPEV